MSQTKSYAIQCPKCGHPQEVELYESVNVANDAGLKDRLLRNQINQAVCAQCRHSFRVDKPLLYHDPAQRLMIYLVPLRGAPVEEGVRDFSNCLSRLNEILPGDLAMPQVHLAFSQVELVERIFLLEAGLNERIIEYVKYLIYSKNLKKLDPAHKILLFNAEDSTPESLCFVVQDEKTRRLESTIQFPRETYKALSETFDNDEQTPSLLELFPGPYISARALLLKDSEIPEPELPPQPGDPPSRLGEPPPAPPPTGGA